MSNGKVAHHHGQVNNAILPDGRPIERSEILAVLINEQIAVVHPVPDQDHFIYQNTMPVTKADVITKYGGSLPAKMQGPNLMCTCGSDAVIMLDGPYKDMAICRAYIQFGKHQTSFQIKDGKLQLDKKTQSERLADPMDIINQDIRNKNKL